MSSSIITQSPRKNFYVPRKEEVEGRAGWRGKIQETDTVKKIRCAV